MSDVIMIVLIFAVCLLRIAIWMNMERLMRQLRIESLESFEYLAGAVSAILVRRKKRD